MPRRETRTLTKVTLNLFEDDYAHLCMVYSSIGAAKAIREILASHVEKLKKETAEVIKQRPTDLPPAELPGKRKKK